MIRIACTKCKSVLTVDDAFAGGVCRCQYCRTIQMVPAHLKGSADDIPAAADAAANASMGNRASGERQSAAGEPAGSEAGNAATSAKARGWRVMGALSDANLLKLGIVVAFILFLLLVVLVLTFAR
ncbi:MAG: hypothetical protein ABR964_02840 [Tepidisphaeraceae bacterium]|jgi:hypothetical protein